MRLSVIPRVVAAIPMIVVGAVRDELHFRRHGMGDEPGMREWYAATIEDLRRALGR